MEEPLVLEYVGVVVHQRPLDHRSAHGEERPGQQSGQKHFVRKGFHEGLEESFIGLCFAVDGFTDGEDGAEG
ncbi:hypothetical protein SDC9_195794 [bioreactor metagenome]|uniref:Uncharacterized protein n=1 Tax=bioreactor metagenome TaxID=1076179 RepID=A0A645ICK8_9ZZZZ